MQGVQAIMFPTEQNKKGVPCVQMFIKNTVKSNFKHSSFQIRDYILKEENGTYFEVSAIQVYVQGWTIPFSQLSWSQSCNIYIVGDDIGNPHYSIFNKYIQYTCIFCVVKHLRNSYCFVWSTLQFEKELKQIIARTPFDMH